MMLNKLCDFLITETPLSPCDVIVVLAGRPERKSYGLKLLQQALAPRLLLSVGRFDVRETAALLAAPMDLITLRNETPPDKRHFWIHLEDGRTAILRATVKGTGTYAELRAIAAFLESRAPGRVGLVSTSIHLRRIRFCCSRIPFFRGKQVYLWAVPEALSVFRRRAWWRRPADWFYLISEFAKLLRYYLIWGR